MNRLFITIFISALCDIKTDASLSHIVAQDLSASVRSQRDINNEDPTISELHITSRIVSRLSTTNIRSTFLNDLEADVEAQFVVQIPDSAFISNFSVIVNGREIVAQVSFWGMFLCYFCKFEVLKLCMPLCSLDNGKRSCKGGLQ